MLSKKLVIDGLEYRSVCNCDKQPCYICFCLFTLHLREINEMLDRNFYKCIEDILNYGDK
jgi:hypothetical protein